MFFEAWKKKVVQSVFIIKAVVVKFEILK